MARVLFISSGLPTILTEIVTRSLADYEDVQLITVVAPPAGLVNAMRETGATVVVGADRHLTCAQVSALLEDLPRSRVFILTPDARMTWLYELRPERVALGEVSPERLAEAIRGRVPCKAGEVTRHG